MQSICALTSVCWWRWQRCPLDTAPTQSLRHIPRFHMTVGSGGNETDMNNSAMSDWTWPEPAGVKCHTIKSANHHAVREYCADINSTDDSQLLGPASGL